MFEIGRIRLRTFERDDLALMENWENDFKVTLYSRGQPLVFKNRDRLEEEYDDYIEDEDKVRTIVEMRESDKAIGIATYRDRSNGRRSADIGTYIGEKDFWNRGLGKDITLALCELLFYHKNYQRLSAWSSGLNKRAHKVLQRYGFKKRGGAKKSGFLLGRDVDWYMFDLLKEDYMERRDEYLQDALDDVKTYLDRYCTLP